MHPGVDWKSAPKTAHWWAVDANGDAHWFKSPNIAPFTDFWFTEPRRPLCSAMRANGARA